MALRPINEINKCPYCGSKNGFIIRSKASGYVTTSYSFDGSERCNSSMYNQIKEKQPKYAKCSDCDRNIGLWNDKSFAYVLAREQKEFYSRSV